MITGIKIMKLVEVISQDDESYYCRELGCHPASNLSISKSCVTKHPEDYIIQKGKPLRILIWAGDW
jgi:hypothetical protein